MLPVFGNERNLRAIDAQLALAPDNVDLLFARAFALDLLGRTIEARDAYIQVVRREFGHRDALANLATLLYNAGYRSAARRTYAELLKQHPSDVPSHVNLGNAMLDAGEVQAARECYERALAIDPAFAFAHQGLAHALAHLGEHRPAEEHRRIGFTAEPIAIRPFRGVGDPVVLLVLASTRRGNVETDIPLDDRTFLTLKLFTDYYDVARPLPQHAVAFNAIGDADLCGAALDVAERLVREQGVTLLNPPARVRATGRAGVARRLRGIEKLVVPRIELVRRDRLATLDMPFPMLLRAPGFHTGEHFEFAANAHDLERAAAAIPGEELFAIQYLDARGADGAYRKYRVLAIDGRLYPVHLARSSHWKVHYFSADLVRSAKAVAEEAAFLNDMPAAIGEGAVSALHEAAQRLALDYAGIDFALDARGNVLLFEANATMRAIAPGADDPNEARRRAAATANAALRDLVRSRATRMMR